MARLANGWMTCMFPAPARARPPGTSQLMLAVVSWTGRRTLLTISSKQTDKTRPCQCGTARCQRVRQLWPTLAAQQPRILRFYSAAPRSARSFNVTRFFCPGQAIGLLVGIAGPDFHDEDGPGQEGQLTEDVILFDIAPAKGHVQVAYTQRSILLREVGSVEALRAPEGVMDMQVPRHRRHCPQKFRPRWVDSI